MQQQSYSSIVKILLVLSYHISKVSLFIYPAELEQISVFRDENTDSNYRLNKSLNKKSAFK
jgi:hypothetical protein